MNCTGGAFTHPNDSGLTRALDAIYGFYLEQNRAARAIQKAATVVYRGRTPLEHCCVALRINFQPNGHAERSESCSLRERLPAKPQEPRAARFIARRASGPERARRLRSSKRRRAPRREQFISRRPEAPLSCSWTSCMSWVGDRRPKHTRIGIWAVTSARPARGTVVHGAICSGSPRTGARRVDASRRRRVELESQTPRRRRRA